MKQYTEIKCPGCGKADLVKNGHSKKGEQRYLCKICRKSFQIDYSYNTWRPGIKEQIEIQTLNSRGESEISVEIWVLQKEPSFPSLKKSTTGSKSVFPVQREDPIYGC